MVYEAMAYAGSLVVSACQDIAPRNLATMLGVRSCGRRQFGCFLAVVRTRNIVGRSA